MRFRTLILAAVLLLTAPLFEWEHLSRYLYVHPSGDQFSELPLRWGSGLQEREHIQNHTLVAKHILASDKEQQVWRDSL